MDVSQNVKQVAEALWDLLVNDPNASRDEAAQHLQEQGLGGVSQSELQLALDRIESRLPADSASGVSGLRASAGQIADQQPIELHATFVTPTPIVKVINAGGGGGGGGGDGGGGGGQQAQPQVVRQVTQNVTERHVTEQHITRSVTEQNVTNNFVREGDTNIDNRVLTEINSRGDVVFDQKVSTETVVATKGGVAVNGDLQGSAVNTGVNDGVIAGDDVKLTDSVVGDGNTQLNDSEVGAFSGRGQATNIDGKNVNTGSGDLVEVDSDGDAQVVTGSGNKVDGATDVDVSDTDGPVDLAVGDGNRQTAAEDNSTTVEDSGNVDNSVEDSANTVVDDSGNTVTQDNDQSTLRVDDSGNTVTEDNDVTDASLSLQSTSPSAEDVLKPIDGPSSSFGPDDSLDQQTLGDQPLDGFQEDPLTSFNDGGDVDMDFDS